MRSTLNTNFVCSIPPAELKFKLSRWLDGLQGRFVSLADFTDICRLAIKRFYYVRHPFIGCYNASRGDLKGPCIPPVQIVRITTFPKLCRVMKVINLIALK